MTTALTAAAQPAARTAGTLKAQRVLRALLPALSLALVLLAIATLNPRAISYFGFTLMLNLAIPIALATMAQMFVIAGNDLDLSIGTFVGFVCCVSATWLRDEPWLGALTLMGCVALYAALGAFLGHLFPVWLGFKGGKGVATYIGLLLGLALWLALAAFCVIWLAIASLTRYSSLAALIASAATPIVLWWSGHAPEAKLFFLLTVLIWFMHRANIARLISGTESKIGRA